MRMTILVLMLVACATTTRRPSGSVPAGTTDSARTSGPAADYLAFVAAEAADRIALVRFGPAGARVEREIPIGLMPTDPDGPHGVTVSPDRRFLYVSTAHGNPYGYLWKVDAATGEVLRRVELGNFPATLALTPDGAFAFIVNFNLHGDMVRSSVSVVAADSMLELARVPTCVMPHGSRINPQGTRQYSACMMDDLLVEIDTRTFGVARTLRLAEHPEPMPAATHQGGGAGGHSHTAGHPDPVCSPTWGQPSADGKAVFVACNKSNEILDVDVERWAVRRRLPAGTGVYNLGVTRDGKLLIATNKRAQSVSIFDTASGRELARVPTIRKVVHGVVISPDDRYAFISVEGIGSEPGTVEIIDLASRRRVASVDVPQMAGGIDFWKIVAAH
jgi:DNA-binding beta-propeller fold protein YncE